MTTVNSGGPKYCLVLLHLLLLDAWKCIYVDTSIAKICILSEKPRNMQPTKEAYEEKAKQSPVIRPLEK